MWSDPTTDQYEATILFSSLSGRPWDQHYTSHFPRASASHVNQNKIKSNKIEINNPDHRAIRTWNCSINMQRNRGWFSGSLCALRPPAILCSERTCCNLPWQPRFHHQGQLPLFAFLVKPKKKKKNQFPAPSQDKTETRTHGYTQPYLHCSAFVDISQTLGET